MRIIKTSRETVVFTEVLKAGISYRRYEESGRWVVLVLTNWYATKDSVAIKLEKEFNRAVAAMGRGPGKTMMNAAKMTPPPLEAEHKPTNIGNWTFPTQGESSYFQEKLACEFVNVEFTFDNQDSKSNPRWHTVSITVADWPMTIDFIQHWISGYIDNSDAFNSTLDNITPNRTESDRC